MLCTNKYSHGGVGGQPFGPISLPQWPEKVLKLTSFWPNELSIEALAWEVAHVSVRRVIWSGNMYGDEGDEDTILER